MPRGIMSEPNFRDIIRWTIAALDSMKPESSCIEALSILIPQNIIVAAFDILDKGKVFKLATSWGRVFYYVEGSPWLCKTQVMIDLPSPTSDYCSCYAFMYNVLINKNQIMCKHVLAVLLARKLNKCIERVATQEEIASVIFQVSTG